MSDYDQMTAAEIQEEIAEINKALKYIRLGGQSYTITSASGAGTSRIVTQADYETLKKDRDKLYNQLRGLEGKKAFRYRASW